MPGIILFYITILCIVVIYSIYLLLYFKFSGDIKDQNEKLAKKLQDHNIQTLLNGSGINNIPNLNLVSLNPNVVKANKCSNGPVYIGATGTDSDCVRTCANSSASVVQVEPDHVVIYDSAVLQPGANCIIGPRPMCNMNTTYAMMTINSVVCRPKFPQLVGGPLGNTMIACNNRIIDDPQNYLWDYLNNVKFSPLTTDIENVDEMLPDGSYRFRCRFNGLDNHNNTYIESNLNRFHPMENYCAALVYSAHPDVKTVFTENGVECDCGDFEETRVKHIDPNDKSSQCSSIAFEVKQDVRNRYLMTVPYKCFTLYSPIEDVGKYLPCPNELFTRQGNQIASVTIPYTTKIDALIEHPVYKDFDASDVGMRIRFSEEITG